MRTPTAFPRQPLQRGMTRRRLILIIAAAVIIVLLLSLKGLAGFYTDYLWFGSVHERAVWSGILEAKVELAATFTVFFFLLMWANLIIVDRLHPAVSGLGPEDELAKKFQEMVTPHSKIIRVLVAAALALFAGTGTSQEWRHWLIFQHAVSFGVKDPQFHKDVGFFVFQLPFLSFLVGWLFIALAIVFVVTAIAHYLNGGIRFQGSGQRVSPKVKAHLSVLLGLIALVKAAGYYYQRYSLDFSTNGVVNGASYTDVHVRLPALTLLMWISLAAFVILLVNIRLQGWVLPVISVGLWAFIALFVGVVYPALVQSIKVAPAQSVLEKPYIARNIAATRRAMGLDHVVVKSFAARQNLSATDLAAHATTLSDVRLWDTRFSIPTVEKLQDIRSYYQFNELAVDRYMVNGKLTPVMIGVRQVNSSNLPASSWVNEHLEYTHGYGAVVAAANTATVDGDPNFAVQDVPPTSSSNLPRITQPSVYYGVGISGFVVAHTKQPEVDYQLPNGANQVSNYRGSGGVQMSSFLARAAFAIRFSDFNLLVSSLITPQSRVMFVRNIRTRVQKVAPFLRLDAHPYPVLLNGGIYWVQDAYTTTSYYPYAQQADTSMLSSASGLQRGFNYARNSVKVLINAYTGKMTFYLMDPRDPIIRAYAQAFPHLFTPASKMSAALRAHLRYPQDLFVTQAAMFSRYHITNPSAFYNAGDAWNLAQSPGSGSPTAALSGSGAGQGSPMNPIYQVMRVPGQPAPTFNILEPFVPRSTNGSLQTLSAFMVAGCDPGHYGQLEVFVTPRGQSIDGPALIDARISAVPAISRQISLLNTNGSSVILGSVLLVPIAQSVLYVRPLYVESSRNQLPELKDVIAIYGPNAAMGTTLSAALSSLFNANLSAIGPTSTGAPVSVPAEVQSLLNQAASWYTQAGAALRAGQLGSYQADISKMGALVQEAQSLSAGKPPTSASGGGSGSATAGSPSSPASRLTTPVAKTSSRSRVKGGNGSRNTSSTTVPTQNTLGSMA